MVTIQVGRLQYNWYATSVTGMQTRWYGAMGEHILGSDPVTDPLFGVHATKKNLGSSLAPAALHHDLLHHAWLVYGFVFLQT